MNRSPIIQKKHNSNLIYNANWPIDIRLLQNHLILKSLNFFPHSQHNSKTPRICYSSQSEIGGEKGGKLTTQ